MMDKNNLMDLSKNSASEPSLRTRKTLLACFAAAFLATFPLQAQAGLDASPNDAGGTDYTVDSGGHNDTVGQGKTDNNANVFVNGALAVNEKNAISIGDGQEIDSNDTNLLKDREYGLIRITGSVHGSSNSGSGGNYGTGRNVIESNSHTTIIVESGAVVSKTGSASNAEAINVHGYNNLILNHGTIKAEHSAAIWFQDRATNPNYKNVVDNYGTIEHVGGGNVIGTSAGSGIVFHNRSTGHVVGDLKFAGGNDELYFEAGSSITGNIDGGGGRNTLSLEGAGPETGKLLGSVKNFQSLEKIDVGTWEITGSLTGFQSTAVKDGILRLTGDNSGYTGTLSITGDGTENGVLEAWVKSLPGNNGTSSNIVVNGTGTLRFIEGGEDTYTGQIVGTGKVEMTGTGVVVLDPANAAGNTYAGGTYIESGAIAIKKDSALGQGDLVMGSDSSIGTLRFDDNMTMTAGGREIILTGKGGGLAAGAGITATIDQVITADNATSELHKSGAGTVILTADNKTGGYTGKTVIEGGTLQLGNGAGSNGSISDAQVDIASSAALAVNHSGAAESLDNLITGAGKVIQRGDNELELTNAANSFQGGTEIESGGITVTNPSAYGVATGAGGANDKSGHITFTGGDVPKTLNIDTRSDPNDDSSTAAATLHIHSATGKQNVVNVSGDQTIGGVDVKIPGDNGGAIKIDSGSTLTVNVGSSLTLENNKGAGGANDIFIDDEGVLNLSSANGWTTSKSGIATDSFTNYSTLNLAGYLDVQADSGTGEVNVNSGALHLQQGNTYSIRELNVNDGAVLSGGGTYSGVVFLNGIVNPDSLTGDNPDVNSFNVGTLTINALDNLYIGSTFRYNYDIVAPNGDGSRNNDLIYLTGVRNIDISDAPGGIVNLKTEYVPTLNKYKRLETGSYLLIDSDGADYFNADLNSLWGLTLNGSFEELKADSPRRDFGFRYGSDKGYTDNQIWLDYAHNSLTMDYGTGFTWGTAGQIGNSLQTKDGKHDVAFEDGDKVHIAADGAVTVDLGPAHPETSGLVVGKTSGTGYSEASDTYAEGTEKNGDVLVTGSGSIVADSDSAVGKYVHDASAGTGSLRPTGKLEKYGAGQLTLANSGGNAFEHGVDIYNGTVVLAQKDVVGKGDFTDDALAITFANHNNGEVDPVHKSLLVDSYSANGQNVTDQTLNNRIIVDDEVKDATLNVLATTDATFTTPGYTAVIVGENARFTIKAGSDTGSGEYGNITFAGNATDIDIGAHSNVYFEGSADSYIKSGIISHADSMITKTGSGTLQIEADSEVKGHTTLYDGVLRVVQGYNYGLAGNRAKHFNVHTANATVAGGGTINADRIKIDGNISPDSYGANTENPEYGWLTLDATGGEVELNGFTMDFDVAQQTTLDADNKPAMPQDLLQIKSGVNGKNVLLEGAIDIVTGSAAFTRGDYLIVRSETQFQNASSKTLIADDAGLNAAISGTLNGKGLSDTSVRGTMTFELRNDAGSHTQDFKKAEDYTNEIWLVSKLNSLVMDWTGAGQAVDGPQSGNWILGSDTMLSKEETYQGTTLDRTTQFQQGDFVYAYSLNSGDSISISMESADGATPTTVIVSGLVVGKNSGGGTWDGTSTTGSFPQAERDGDVVIEGKGGISANKDMAFGEYLYDGIDPEKDLKATGKLEKFGTGDLVLANSGGNRFKEGVDIYNGKLVLKNKGVISHVPNYLGTPVNENFLSMVVTFANNESGTLDTQTKTLYVSHYQDAAGTTVTSQTLTNALIIEPDIQDAVLVADADTTLTGAGDGANSKKQAVILVGIDHTNTTGSAQLTLQAGDTSAGYGDIVLNNANTDTSGHASDPQRELADVYMFNASKLVATGAENIYVNKGISDDGLTLTTLEKSGDGTLQINGGANNFSGAVTVTDGTFRVREGVVFGGDDYTSKFELQDDGAVSGAGTIKSAEVMINGAVSPDAIDAAQSAAARAGSNDYATLTFSGEGAAAPTAVMQDYTYQYDAREANWKKGDAAFDIDNASTSNDLLKFTDFDSVTINTSASDSIINIRTDSGGHLDTGYYLLTHSDGAITLSGTSQDDTGLNAIHTLQINGSLLTQFSPRASYELMFNDTSLTGGNQFSDATVNQSEIWLASLLNSLQMDLDAGALTADTTIDWNTSGESWLSRQNNGGEQETRIRNGDFAYITNDTTHKLTVNLTDDFTLSGFQTGLKSDDVTGGDGDITITGDFGITTIQNNGSADTPIEGVYAKTDGSANPANQEFDTTGKFNKYGAGTTAFENTGDNMFTNGIDIYGGTVAFNAANQIQTGSTGVDTYAKITFKSGATGTTSVKPNATVELTKSQFDIETDATGTFDVGVDADTGDRLGLLLSGDSGIGSTNGDLDKVGAGVLQLGETSQAYDIGTGSATVSEGEFRVVGERGGSSVAFNSDSFSVATDGAVGGGGVVNAGTITVNGTIRPDSDTLTAAKMDVDSAKATGNLTLGNNTSTQNITLDGFAYEYDFTGHNLENVHPSSPADLIGNTYDPATSQNDLLTLQIDKTGGGAITMGEGDIRFGQTLTSGKYLLIDANASIGLTGGETDVNKLLTAQNHAGEALSNNSPRGKYEFVLANRDTGDANSQLWIDLERNTLSMDRTTGGNWGDGNWTSKQTVDDPANPGQAVHEKVYDDGDHAYITNNAAGAIDVNIDRNYTASGVTIDGSDDITLSGNGGLLVTKADGSNEAKWIEGDYVRAPNFEPDLPEVDVTGAYVKKGGGTLTFDNAGSNNFKEGMYLQGGLTAFSREDQIGTTDGAGDDTGIHFDGDQAGLRADKSVSVGNWFDFADGVTGRLEAADGVEFSYRGDMTGTDLSAFDKTGSGLLKLENTGGESAFAGFVGVREGELGVYGDYGNTRGFEVDGGATLSGWGTIGALADGGVIKSGGTLAPKGLSQYSEGALPVDQPLTINGSLTFEGGSNFNVTITQYADPDDPNGKYIPVSDHIVVTGADSVVTIDPSANLNVDIDFWGDTLTLRDFNEKKSDHFTLIDASAADDPAANPEAEFTLNMTPIRGVKIVQGWNSDSGKLYQLWFEADADSGYQSICNKPNRQEIGHNLDDLTWLGDPNMNDLLHYLHGLDDPSACDALDRLTGDIAANVLQANMKRSWRHVYNRFDRDPVEDPCAPACARPLADRPTGGQIWAESYGRHFTARYDNNANPYHLNRLGLAVGYDHRFSDTTNFGVTLNYSNPQLKQDTGKAKWDDYEIGLYGRTWVRDLFEVRGYVGYSHQDYSIDRHVVLPGYTVGDTAVKGFNDFYSSSVSGNSLAASLEVTRPFMVNRFFRLRPVVAFDYEQAWMSGFREEGSSPTALEYDKSNYKQFMVRAGLHGEVRVTDRVDLQARAQYTRQLNGDSYPVTGVRFANAGGVGQRTARIRGEQVGKNSVNLGVGMDIKLNREKANSIYVNYDVDIYRRQIGHAGEIGIMFRW